MSYILIFIGVVYIIYGVFRMLYIDIKLHKLHEAKSDLHRLPLEEWEAKWGEFVKQEYGKCDDPHRQEIEEDMEFFHKELEELKKEDGNENPHRHPS